MTDRFILFPGKIFLKLFLVLSYPLLNRLPAHAQDPGENSFSSLSEKIYLQLDGKVYTTDKIIWFKSIVTDAVQNAPTRLSGVLYVELIGPDERIAEKKIIKLVNGTGEGFFELHRDYPPGVYLVRAYTEWNKNFGSDFIFSEYIQVLDTSPGEKQEPITGITLSGTNNEKHITATFDPFVIDSTHKKELKVIVGLTNLKDTLFLRKNSDNKYTLDYPLPDKNQFVTLQMLTKNLASAYKTIAVDEDYLDLQFFPESGVMVHGIPSKIGFKALDYNGKGTTVSGDIVDSEGKFITAFKSNLLGMGYFVLPDPDSTKAYFARITSRSEEKLSLLFPLPRIASTGNVLSVSKAGDAIRMTVVSNNLKEDTVFIRISCRGMPFFFIKGRLRNGILIYSLPTDEFPDGIMAFTLTDRLGQPLAERLYFNQRPEVRMNIALSADKPFYNPRDLTRLDIETTNNKGEHVDANLSVLVINRNQMGQIQDTRRNILSSFLLSSELKGEIENPGFYFRKDPDSHNDLEALMLTQGWRKYNYTRPMEKIRFQPEPILSVTGTVGGIFSRKGKKGIELTMMTFGHNRSVQTQKTDSLGRFNFNVNDEYGQNLNVLIQSANNAGKKKDYTINLDKKVSPVITFNQIRTIEKPDSVVLTFVRKNAERKKVEETFRLSTDILLGEVVVEAYRLTPERKKVMQEYGKPDEVIEGKTIQEKEQKWSYGLYSVLLFNFPDKVMIRRARDGNLYAKVRNSEMTLVVIDGIPVKYYDYPNIPNIPPSEVKSFEIIESANNFSKLFLEAFPGASPMDAPPWGDVIAIYTYAGNGIYGAKRTAGLFQTSVPVFSATREFYAPRYPDLKPDDWIKPDLRALIDWEPNLNTGNSGKVSASFYNADNAGEMQVIVEAISETGEIGYQELIYPVKRKNE